MQASPSARQKLVIAVDGPSGSGKSSISREVAKRLSFNYLDTGAMYRMITYFLTNLNDRSEPVVEKVLTEENIDFKISIDPSQINFMINHKNVSEIIRTEKITSEVSHFAAMKCVRSFLVAKQREIVANSRKSIIVEGRDIGSVVLPSADFKIFITANEEIRAQRRAKEINSSSEKVLNDQRIRDEKDSKRSISPLIKTNDSYELDTSFLDFEQSVNKFMELVQNV